MDMLSQWSFLYSTTLSLRNDVQQFHNIHNFCYLKNNSYKALGYQHKIEKQCLILT